MCAVLSRQAGAKGRVLLVQRKGRKARTEHHLALVASDLTGAVAIKQIKQCGGCSRLRMRWRDAPRLGTILTVNVQQDWVFGVAQQAVIRGTQHQVPGISVGSCRWQMSRFP